MNISKYGKLIQDDNYIDSINEKYMELINNYSNGDLIDVRKYQNDYCWFPMNWNKDKQKYIFDKDKADRFIKIYNNDMIQDTYYMKFYIDALNKMLRLFQKDSGDEIAMYVPEHELLCINDKNKKEFDMIRNSFYALFPVKEESHLTVDSFKNI